MVLDLRYIVVGNIYSGFRTLEAALGQEDLPLLDPAKPQKLSYSEGGGGAKLILDPRIMTPKVLDRWIKCIPGKCAVIHLQCGYEETLLTIAAESEGAVQGPEAEIVARVKQFIDYNNDSAYEKELSRLLIALYKNDLWARRLKQSHPEFLSIYKHHFEDRWEEVRSFLGFEVDSIIRLGNVTLSEPESYAMCLPISEQLESKIRLYEDRRLMLNCARFFSEGCRNQLKLGEREPKYPAALTEQVDIIKNRVVILVDFTISETQMRQLLPPAKPGKCPSVIILIFSHMHYIRDVLSDPFCLQHLENGRLKLWHASEWRDVLVEEYKRLRSSILHCSTVVAPDGTAIKGDIDSTLDRLYASMVQAVNAEHQGAIGYYKSEAFEKRLQAIANGEKPRILIEQACRAISTKQFSRNSAQVLKDMGYEVFIHEPCRDDRMDFAIASTIEINRFKPDLVFRVPNIFGYVPYRDIPNLPVLMPLQDLEPHIDFVEHVRKESVGPYDIVYIIEERFKQPLLDAGRSPDQLMFEQLPSEAPRFDVAAYQPKRRRDVGFIKTLTEQVGLLSMIHPGKLSGMVPMTERTAIARAERVIVEELKAHGGMEFYACRGLGDPFHWAEALESFCHEQLCLTFVNALQKAGFDLALSGSNWDKHPHLASQALGHVESREAYQKRFLDNRINISLNPWDQYHPRIFDGGRCGAFFLVYRVPDEFRWQALPDTLVAGEHFDYFDSAEDLVQKCHYYLERPELCAEMGLNMKRVLDAEHSYERICSEIIERFHQLVKARQPSNKRPAGA